MLKYITMVCLFTNLSYATYKVNYKQGDIKVKRDNEWVEIQDSLQYEDLIKLEENAVLSLQRGNKEYSISKSGIYSIANITSNKSKKGTFGKFIKEIGL